MLIAYIDRVLISIECIDSQHHSSNAPGGLIHTGGTGDAGFFSKNCSNFDGEGLKGPPLGCAPPVVLDHPSSSCLMGEKVLLEEPIPVPLFPEALELTAMVGPSKS